jgi:hypothetical protein
MSNRIRGPYYSQNRLSSLRNREPRIRRGLFSSSPASADTAQAGASDVAGRAGLGHPRGRVTWLGRCGMSEMDETRQLPCRSREYPSRGCQKYRAGRRARPEPKLVARPLIRQNRVCPRREVRPAPLPWCFGGLRAPLLEAGRSRQKRVSTAAAASLSELLFPIAGRKQWCRQRVSVDAVSPKQHSAAARIHRDGWRSGRETIIMFRWAAHLTLWSRPVC